MIKISTLLIRLYRVTLSPYLPSACRYLPTCSNYSEEAIVRYGFVQGSWIGFKRLVRCQPWGGSGYDPVP